MQAGERVATVRVVWVKTRDQHTPPLAQLKPSRSVASPGGASGGDRVTPEVH